MAKSFSVVERAMRRVRKDDRAIIYFVFMRSGARAETPVGRLNL